MTTAGVIPHLSRLLSLPISATMLAVVAKTMGQCAVHQKYYKRFSELFPRDVLRPLINLLQSSDTELLIAVAGAINDIADGQDKEASRHLLDEDVVPQLCHMSSNCTDLLALQKVASAIGRITAKRPIYDGEDDRDIEIYVLRPLIDLVRHGELEVQIRAIRALYLLGQSDNLVYLWGETVVLPHIVPLITSDNDELFVEALLSAIRWTDAYPDEDDPNPAKYINLSLISRLIRPLSSHEDRVAAASALAICEVVCFTWFPHNVSHCSVLEESGVSPLIRLLSSKNMVVVEAVASAIAHLPVCNLVGFVDQDIIPALVDALRLTFDSQLVVESIITIMDAVLDDMLPTAEELVREGAITYFVRLLSLEEDYKIVSEFQLINCISGVVKSSRTAQITFLNAGGVSALIRYVSATPLNAGIELISWLTSHSPMSRVELLEAGAESILSGYLMSRRYLCEEKITEALRSLGFHNADAAGEIGHEVP